MTQATSPTDICVIASVNPATVFPSSSLMINGALPCEESKLRQRIKHQPSMLSRTRSLKAFKKELGSYSRSSSVERGRRGLIIQICCILDYDCAVAVWKG